MHLVDASTGRSIGGANLQVVVGAALPQADQVISGTHPGFHDQPPSGELEVVTWRSHQGGDHLARYDQIERGLDGQFVTSGIRAHAWIGALKHPDDAAARRHDGHSTPPADYPNAVVSLCAATGLLRFGEGPGCPAGAKTPRLAGR